MVELGMFIRAIQALYRDPNQLQRQEMWLQELQVTEKLGCQSRVAGLLLRLMNLLIWFMVFVTRIVTRPNLKSKETSIRDFLDKISATMVKWSNEVDHRRI